MSETKCMSDLLTELHEDGFGNARSDRIHHGISTRAIDRPQMDGSGRYQFGPKNVRQIKEYLANVPSPGRRRKAEVAAT